MRPKKEEALVAINCRIPKDVHQRMVDQLLVTKKTAASFVADAIEQYVELLPDEDANKQLTNSTKIDRFAYNLERT